MTLAYFLSIQIFQNSIGIYLKSFLSGLLVLLILLLIRKLILKYVRHITAKLPTQFDDLLVDILNNISTFTFIVIAIYITTQNLYISIIVDFLLRWLFGLTLTWEGVKASHALINYLAKLYISLQKIASTSSDVSIINTVVMILKIGIWGLAILLLLSNMGYNVSTLVASLGIGGLAVALAVQNILGDLFSSLSLFFDKPFQIGDYINTGTDGGTVEQIGLKTTRIRTPQGQLLIVPNSDLTKSRIQNFRKMKKRRVIFNIGIAYETSTTKVKKMTKLIQQIIESQKNTEFSRCFFKEYGDFALIFEIVYFIKTRDYTTYIQIHNNINIDIKEIFEKNKINFAYPTQIVYLNK